MSLATRCFNKYVSFFSSFLSFLSFLSVHLRPDLAALELCCFFFFFFFFFFFCLGPFSLWKRGVVYGVVREPPHLIDDIVPPWPSVISFYLD